MPEEQELKLTVSVDDQASDQLSRLRESLRQLQSASVHAQEILKSKATEAANETKKTEKEVSQLATRAGFFGGVAAGMSENLVKMGHEMIGRSLDLKSFSYETVRLEQSARSIGTTTAQLQHNIEMLQRAGLSTAEAQRGLTGLYERLGEMQRLGSSTIHELAQSFGGSSEQFKKLRDALVGSDPIKALNALVRAGAEERERVTKLSGPIAGAYVAKQFFARMGFPELSEVNVYFEEVSAARKEFLDERDKQVADYFQTSTKAYQEFKKTTDALSAVGIMMATPGMKALEKIATTMSHASERMLAGVFAGVEAGEKLPEPEGFWGKLNPFNELNIAREKAAIEAQKKRNEEIRKLQEGDHGPNKPLHFMDGSDGGATNTEATQELTDQLKRLGDMFEEIAPLGALSTQMGGLGGGLGGGGFGRASLGGFGGGGGPGGDGRAPYGSDVGPGTGRGAGSTPATGGGGQPGLSGPLTPTPQGSGSLDPTAMDPMAPAGHRPGAGVELTTIRSPAGKEFTVAKDYAPNFQRFINSYEAAGGQFGPDTGGLGSRGNKSYHPLGRAIDVNQTGYGIRSKQGKTLPQDVEDRLAFEAGLYPGSRFKSRSDIGHFEVRNRAVALQKQREWTAEKATTPPSVVSQSSPIKTSGVWSPTTPYEYTDASHRSWYANFDFEKGLVPGAQLGRGDIDRPSDVNARYGEQAIKPGSKSWEQYTDAQIKRAADSKVGYIEFDNADYAYERNPQAVRNAYQKAGAAGLSVMMKNPNAAQVRDLGLLKTPDGRWVTGGAIFEKGAMTPQQFAAARAAAGRPDLGGQFVRFGGGVDQSLKAAVEATPGTAYQHGSGEYKGMKTVTSGAAMDRSGVDVQTKGKLEVNVKAPEGTTVKAEGSGVLEKTSTNREVTQANAEE